MVEDLDSMSPMAEEGDVAALLRDRGVRWISFDDWKRIDRIERERGEAQGRPRRKVLDLEELRLIAHGQSTGD